MKVFLKTPAAIFLVIVLIPQSAGKGSKKAPKQDVGMMSDVDPEEPEEMRELAQDRFEATIQRDLCPWAECAFCTCDGQRPMCSHAPAAGYRGPTACRRKDKIQGRRSGQCFFEGGEQDMDCTSTNSDYSICFSEPSLSNEFMPQICIGFFVDCENLVDFCNCSRACEVSHLPPTPVTAISSVTEHRHPAARITDRQVAPSRTTPKPIANTQPSGSENEILSLTTARQQGHRENRSDTSVSKTTGIHEGTTASVSPELQDYDTGFKSMLSGMGILALTFGGLLLVCLVFIITVVCTCTCKSHRKRATKHHHKFEQKGPHAYYYVDVDANGAVTTDIHQGKNPTMINPVYDVALQKPNPKRINYSNGSGCIYSEADSAGFITISPQQTENQYAECRPKSLAVSIAPSEAATYMDLDDDQKVSKNLRVLPYTEIRNSAVYTDLHFGEESLNNDGNTESDSETSGTSAEPDDTDTSSGSEVSLSSADSGVEEHHKADSVSDDFEGENAHYFEAKTLPLRTHSKSTDSVPSQEIKQKESSRKKSSDKSPKIMDCNSLKKGSEYQKLRSKSKDRSFSIDSGSSDNTYNALTPNGTLKIAEEDGQYSTLVREGQEGKKKENETSDSDNTYSELKNGGS